MERQPGAPGNPVELIVKTANDRPETGVSLADAKVMSRAKSDGRRAGFLNSGPLMKR